MALTCGFYNSVDGDRKYDATQFASLFDGVITDGVVAAVGDFFATTPGGGMVVNVGTGRAWFNRTWTYSDAKIPLTLDASDLLYDRIDAVVLEIDTSVAVRDNSIKVIKGTPAQEPQKPVLTNEGDVHQYALAYVRVKASSIEVGAGDITINVGQDDCPFVTSIVDTPELDVLFAQWDAQFTAWFENVQSQLEGDVAANLQRQIDANKEAIKNVKTADTLSVKDLLYTTRKDVDDRFLLCNGASYNREDYPLIEKDYPFDISKAGSWALSYVVNPSGFYNNRIGFEKVGNYLASAVSIYSSSRSTIKISYIRIEDISPTTTSGQITTVDNAYNAAGTFDVSNLRYVNNFYVIVGCKNGDEGYILYASMIDGPWAAVPILGMNQIYDIVYSDETHQYYLFGKTGGGAEKTYGVLARSSNINTGWYTTNIVTPPVVGYKTSLLSGMVKDGVLYMVGCKQQSSSQSIAIVAIMKDPNSSAATAVVREISANIAMDCCANVIKYINNEFLIGGIIAGVAMVWATSDMDSISVSTKRMGLNIGATATNNDMYYGVYDITYDEKLQKYFYAITLYQSGGNGSDAIVTSSDFKIEPGSPYKYNTMATFSGRYNLAKSVTLYGDYLHVGFLDAKNNIVYDRFITLRLFKIPSISISSGYVYIKAKENDII